MQRSGFSLVELMVAIAIIIILAGVLLPALTRAREAAKRSVCQSNLKHWGLICKMYAREAPGETWPPLQARAGDNIALDAFSFTPWLEAVYPEYLTDLALLSCPSGADSLDSEANGRDLVFMLERWPYLAGRSYAYFGWVIDKADRPLVDIGHFPALAILSTLLGGGSDLDDLVVNAQMAAGLDAQLRANPIPSLDPTWLQEIFDRDIFDISPHPGTGEALGNGAGSTLYRLREGIERFLITDVNNPAASAVAQSKIWVMFDQSVPRGDTIITNHLPGGANVLYMDGHVEYVSYTHGPYDPQLGEYADGPATPPVMPSIARTVGTLGALR